MLDDCSLCSTPKSISSEYSLSGSFRQLMMTTNDLLEGAQKGSAYINALMATNTKAEAANHSASGTTEQDDEGNLIHIA